MNLTEDRLRSALQETADEIAPDRIPPLRLPPGLAARQHARIGLRRYRWPAAAAAAVLAVVAISVALTGGPRPARLGQFTARLQPPPYYIALTAMSKGPTPRLDAVIHDTRTGATVATIKPPRPFTTFSEVTGAADDRTFVLAAQPRPWPVVRDPAAFFRARFDAATGKVDLTRLAVPELTAASELASVALPQRRRPRDCRRRPARAMPPARSASTSLVRGTVRTWQDPARSIRGR